ncbi:hypothetical protein [Streptomyces rubrogriseus]|uniref:hypothetical protein n=1 Tax=Streptomyces rubrogriseus TaxID=194673 RepID=UPI0019419409|nr:hypothetical protein [Streptomyces rubrogriseus]
MASHLAYRGVEDRARILREQTSISGVVIAGAFLELAVCFHHAVLNDHARVDTGIGRPRGLTRGGDHANYADIARCVPGRADQGVGGPQLDSEQRTRGRWRALVTARQAHVRTGQ